MNLLFFITTLTVFALGYYIGMQMSHGRQVQQHIQDARDNKRLVGLHSLRNNK